MFKLMRSLFLFTILVGNQSRYCLVMWLQWHKLKTREEESSRSQVRCIEMISLLQPILGTRRIRVPRLWEESEKERCHCLWVTNTETSLPVGYEYRDVTARGLRIQRLHCLWVTNTETSLPVGYEYRDFTACAFRTQTSLPFSVCFDFAFWNGRKRHAAGKWPKGNNSPAVKRVLNVMTSPPWILLFAAALALRHCKIVFW